MRYKYRCLNKHVFIASHGVDEAIKYCTEEGCNMPVQRVIGKPQIHYSGVGFYITDNPTAKNPGSE